MGPSLVEQLEELRKKLRSALSNRLTYPKTVIGVAGGRLLTQEEIQKAYNLLDACITFVDAELTLLMAGLEKPI